MPPERGSFAAGVGGVEAAGVAGGVAGGGVGEEVVETACPLGDSEAENMRTASANALTRSHGSSAMNQAPTP